MWKPKWKHALQKVKPIVLGLISQKDLLQGKQYY